MASRFECNNTWQFRTKQTLPELSRSSQNSCSNHIDTANDKNCQRTDRRWSLIARWCTGFRLLAHSHNKAVTLALPETLKWIIKRQTDSLVEIGAVTYVGVLYGIDNALPLLAQACATPTWTANTLTSTVAYINKSTRAGLINNSEYKLFSKLHQFLTNCDNWQKAHHFMVYRDKKTSGQKIPVI